jgi:hypothetical protein
MRPKVFASESLYEQQVKHDISQNLASTLRNNVGMSPEAAMRKVTMELLANNPFVPPTVGCPVNDLPNELLAYIFLLGTIMEEEDEDLEADDEVEGEYADGLDDSEWEDISDDEDEDMEAHVGGKPGKMEEVWLDEGYEPDEEGDGDEDEEDEEDEEIEIPFQVLVSHVCRHWREIALESSVLWTKLDFLEGPPFAKSKVWIQRSRSSPLKIYIDCTEPEDHDYPGHDDSDSDSESVHARTPGSHGSKYEEEHGECPHDPSFYSLDDFNSILDIIIPHVAQWRLLDVSVSYYEYMYTLLPRLASCPSAPLLKTLVLHHYEDVGEGDDEGRVFEPPEFSTPFLLFNGIAPNLVDVTLWGVHLDWDRSLSFLTGLQDLELAYHARNVRPSFSTFSRILSASPELRVFTLCLSGPAEHNNMENDWGTNPIEIPSLKDLVLSFHDPKYITALVQLLCTPNVTSLVLDYDAADYSDFVQALVKCMPGKSKSLLAGLEHLKIAGLPCNNKSAELFLDQLVGLQTLNLNCTGEEEEMFFELLWRPLAPIAGPPKIYCPNLHTIWTIGVVGEQMKTFIEARKAAGVPIKKVFMSEDDEVDDNQTQWIREHVEALEFFEPSDGEDFEVVEDLDQESG